MLWTAHILPTGNSTQNKTQLESEHSGTAETKSFSINQFA
jgi:hypothetical protein